MFGCKSAMPMAEALRRCPQAIVVSPSRGRYDEVSSQVFEIFNNYTPLVEGLSIDEAFLDVTGSRSLFGDGETIARRIRADVFEATGLTCSAGVASSKFAAKIASDVNKPDGLTVVGPDVAAFLAPLPLERMWGIGPKTAPTLRRLGYATLGDLARADARGARARPRRLGRGGPRARARHRRARGRARSRRQVDRCRMHVRRGPHGRRRRSVARSSRTPRASPSGSPSKGLDRRRRRREAQVRRLHAPHAPKDAARARQRHHDAPRRRASSSSSAFPSTAHASGSPVSRRRTSAPAPSSRRSFRTAPRSAVAASSRSSSTPKAASAGSPSRSRRSSRTRPTRPIRRA